MTRSPLLAAVSLAAVLAASAPAGAERTTVLRQIDVPHNYYFREMYLPQLTSGPSALSWAPCRASSKGLALCSRRPPAS